MATTKLSMIHVETEVEIINIATTMTFNIKFNIAKNFQLKI